MTPATPTKADRPFHNIKEAYARNALTKGIEEGTITTEDEGFITAFIDELKASNGICTSRANKLTYILIRWRQHIGPYSSNVIAHLYSGVSALKASTINGEPYSQNTLRDYITTLKQFYQWLIENGISAVPVDKVKKIKPPAWDTMTKTASQLLTEEEVVAMLNVCFTSRDRALISMLYEDGFGVKELGTLTWEQITFDDHGLIVNVNMKTEKLCYVRLVTSAPFLAQWKNDYPCTISPQGVVFILNLRRPLKYDPELPLYIVA